MLLSYTEFLRHAISPRPAKVAHIEPANSYSAECVQSLPVLKGLIIMNSLQCLRLCTDWIPVQSLQGSVILRNRNIPSRERVPGAEWMDGCRKQMLALEHCQYCMCRRPGTQIVCTNKERNVCFLDVSFKWGESYKKHTSRTEPRSQGQAPVRQAHVQHHSY